MPCRRFLSTTLAVLAACIACLISNSARAQTITIPAAPIRDVNDRTNSQITAFSISRSDCLKNDVWHFTINDAQAFGLSLEVWVGQGSNDCTLQTSRIGTAAICTKVAPSANVTSTIQTVDVRTQDIALVESGLYGDRTTMPGTADNCFATQATSLPQPLTLYFMLFSGGQAMPTTTYTWPQPPISTVSPFNIDLVGPSPPTGVSAEGASTFIKVSWTINPDTDVQGYRFFCDPPPQGLPDGGAAIDAATTTSDASGATCTTPDASSTTDDASDGSDDGSSDDGSSSTTTDAGSSTCVVTEAGPVTTCGGTKGQFFVQNQAPSPDVINAFSCGSVGGNSNTTGIIQGFSTFQTIAVSVTSTDLVGNVGGFSPIICATTEPVNGFIDLYHKDGGTAGGGFCSMTARPGRTRSSGFLYGFIVLGAIAGHRLRRRRPSN
jgi:hypothetical protein